MSGQHGHNTLKNFRPLAPTISVSHRLQHISTPNGSSASFAHIVASQWRADVASNRKTWAVVGTKVEASFLYRDLVANAVADTSESSISRESVVLSTRAGDCTTNRRPGQLVIMPFSHLRELLFLGFFVNQPLLSWIGNLGGPTVVMDFNWGNVTFDMAFSCSMIAKYVKTSINKRTNVFMACTVSNNTTTYFGEVNQHLQVQRVMTPFDADAVTLRFFKNQSPREALARPPRIENGHGESRRRVLLVMDGYELPDDIMPQSLDSVDLVNTGELEFPLLDMGTSYVGGISGLRGVIIWPYTAEGWEMCEGQPTRCSALHRMPRSQAEVYYYSRYMHDTVDAEAAIMQTEEEFNTSLPAICNTSPAHTMDFTALLICCKLVWPSTAIAKLPVCLPQDKQALTSQVEILVMKGILEASPGKSRPLDHCELSILDTKTALTNTGKITASLSVTDIDSPHSAHLLAQLLDPNGQDPALSQTSEAVVNAILSLAVVTESLNGATRINEVISLQKDIRGDDEWYNTELYGVGAGEVWRGPIWLALAIWQKLRDNYLWRVPFDDYDEECQDDRLDLNNGELHVLPYRTYEWDTAFEIIVDRAHARGLDFPDLSDTARLTAEEMIAVEKALVRAYLNKLVYLTDLGDGLFDAFHLLTGRKIRRPFDSQAGQVWWQECQRRTALMSRDGSSDNVFFIYTHMRYGMDEVLGEVAPIPLDMTYVSYTAVELVLKEAGKLELMPKCNQESSS